LIKNKGKLFPGYISACKSSYYWEYNAMEDCEAEIWLIYPIEYMLIEAQSTNNC
jgi:hypothetical protein